MGIPTSPQNLNLTVKPRDLDNNFRLHRQDETTLPHIQRLPYNNFILHFLLLFRTIPFPKFSQEKGPYHAKQFLKVNTIISLTSHFKVLMAFNENRYWRYSPTSSRHKRQLCGAFAGAAELFLRLPLSVLLLHNITFSFC